jgi:hypothetical protein
MKCLCLLLVILVLYWCYNNNNIVEGLDNLSCICTLTGSKDLQNCKCTIGCYDNIMFKKYDNKGNERKFKYYENLGGKSQYKKFSELIINNKLQLKTNEYLVHPENSVHDKLHSAVGKISSQERDKINKQLVNSDQSLGQPILDLKQCIMNANDKKTHNKNHRKHLNNINKHMEKRDPKGQSAGKPKGKKCEVGTKSIPDINGRLTTYCADKNCDRLMNINKNNNTWKNFFEQYNKNNDIDPKGSYDTDIPILYYKACNPTNNCKRNPKCSIKKTGNDKYFEIKNGYIGLQKCCIPK